MRSPSHLVGERSQRRDFRNDFFTITGFASAAFTKHYTKSRVSHYLYTKIADSPRMPQNGDNEDAKMVRAIFSGLRATARAIDKRVGA
jgi:hypothetical protein